MTDTSNSEAVRAYNSMLAEEDNMQNKVNFGRYIHILKIGRNVTINVGKILVHVEIRETIMQVLESNYKASGVQQLKITNCFKVTGYCKPHMYTIDHFS